LATAQSLSIINHLDEDVNSFLFICQNNHNFTIVDDFDKSFQSLQNQAKLAFFRRL